VIGKIFKIACQGVHFYVFHAGSVDPLATAPGANHSVLFLREEKPPVCGKLNFGLNQSGHLKGPDYLFFPSNRHGFLKNRQGFANIQRILRRSGDQGMAQFQPQNLKGIRPWTNRDQKTIRARKSPDFPVFS
jgi:hypothetical protein